MKIIVSACLLGDNVKYDGTNNKNDELIKFLKNYEIIKVCPECFGGLKVPRVPAEIVGDRVINKDGIDVTNGHLLGAEKALRIAKDNDIKIAILKKNSPSCGSGKVYDGTFSHTLIEGDGITAKILKNNGIIIYNEDNYKDILKGEYYEKD